MGIIYKNKRRILTKQTKNKRRFVYFKHNQSEKIVNYYKRDLKIFVRRNTFW